MASKHATSAAPKTLLCPSIRRYPVTSRLVKTTANARRITRPTRPWATSVSNEHVVHGGVARPWLGEVRARHDIVHIGGEIAVGNPYERRSLPYLDSRFPDIDATRRHVPRDVPAANAITATRRKSRQIRFAGRIQLAGSVRLASARCGAEALRRRLFHPAGTFVRNRIGGIPFGYHFPRIPWHDAVRLHKRLFVQVVF